MKKNNILSKSENFNRIIKEGKKIISKNIIIYLELTTNDNYHFGLAVGKKIGNAVVRNKIKRQLRSIIDEKKYKNNFNCVILVKKSILTQSFFDIRKEILNLFKQVNIIEEEKK